MIVFVGAGDGVAVICAGSRVLESLVGGVVTSGFKVGFGLGVDGNATWASEVAVVERLLVGVLVMDAAFCGAGSVHAMAASINPIARSNVLIGFSI